MLTIVDSPTLALVTLLPSRPGPLLPLLSRTSDTLSIYGNVDLPIHGNVDLHSSDFKRCSRQGHSRGPRLVSEVI